MVTVTPNSRVPRNLIISITKPLKICVRIGVFSGMVNLHSQVNHFFKFIVLAHNSLVYLHGRFQATFSQVYVEEHICIFVTLKASCTSTKPAQVFHVQVSILVSTWCQPKIDYWNLAYFFFTTLFWLIRDQTEFATLSKKFIRLCRLTKLFFVILLKLLLWIRNQKAATSWGYSSSSFNLESYPLVHKWSFYWMCKKSDYFFETKIFKSWKRARTSLKFIKVTNVNVLLKPNQNLKSHATASQLWAGWCVLQVGQQTTIAFLCSFVSWERG